MPTAIVGDRAMTGRCDACQRMLQVAKVGRYAHVCFVCCNAQGLVPEPGAWREPEREEEHP